MLWARVMRGIISIEKRVAPFFSQRLVGTVFGQWLAHADDSLTVSYQVEVGLSLLWVGSEGPHLGDQVGLLKDFRATRNHLRPFCSVFIVQETRGVSGTPLDNHFDAGFCQLRYESGDHGNASFARKTLFDDSDDHRRPSLLARPAPGGPRPRTGVEGGGEGEEPTLKPPSQDATTFLNRGKDICVKVHKQRVRGLREKFPKVRRAFEI